MNMMHVRAGPSDRPKKAKKEKRGKSTSICTFHEVCGGEIGRYGGHIVLRTLLYTTGREKAKGVEEGRSSTHLLRKYRIEVHN